MATTTADWNHYKQLLHGLPYGKVLPAAVYIHRDMEPCRKGSIGQILALLSERHAIGDEFNVVKFRTDAPRVSFLCYPHFFEHPHPSLEKSITIDLASGKSFQNGYGDNLNPPILHRKELLLATDHPHAGEYAALSAAEEQAGLYENTSIIGFRVNWERLLAARGLTFDGHSLVRSSDNGAAHVFPSPVVAVQRHKTALTRYQLSKPVKTLLEFSQMPVGSSFFDYGCGLGADVRGLRELGFEASGWDPVHAPDAVRVEADVVNLGYVLNVIEDPAERLETLVSAWRLSRRLLVVAALIGDSSADTPQAIALNDGILTRRNTFQKYFSQRELQSYLEDGLETSAVPVALGIFYVFRDSGQHQLFLQSRSRRSIDWDALALGLTKPEPPPKAPRPTRPTRADPFAVHQPLLEEFWSVVLRLGRMPLPCEFARHSELGEAFGSAKRALRHLLSQQGRQDTFRRAQAARKADLLVYLALANLRKTIPFSHLPEVVRCDIATFFRNYKLGLAEGRDLLHAAADSNNIAMACEETAIGWQDDHSLYVHTGLVDSLPTVLRTLIACAELLYGNLREADILKIHKHSGKVTFLSYAEFDSALLPKLTLRTKVNLRTQRIEVFDAGDGQLLYFKERYVDPTDPQCPRLREISESLMRLGISNARFVGPSANELCRILRAEGRDDLIQALGVNSREERELGRDRA